MKLGLTNIRPRLHFLDGLRGAAALFVTVHHAYLEESWSQALPGFKADRSEILPNWLLTVLHPMVFGMTAVVVFIALSGFCLMMPVAMKDEYSMGAGLFSFFQRRAKRILPPYYAALVLSLIAIRLVPVLNSYSDVRWNLSLPAFGLGTIISHILLLHDFNSAWISKIDYPMWSVAVEWQIYFLFPFVLLPLMRRIGVIPSVIVILCICRATGIINNFHLLSRHGISIATPWMFGVFTMGAAAATYAFSPRNSIKIAGKRQMIGATWILLLSIWIATSKHWVITSERGDLLIGAATSAFLLYLTMTARESPNSIILRIFEFKPLVDLGAFSYSLYLVHAPVIALVHIWLRYTKLSPIYIVGCEIIVGTGLSLLMAYGFHRLFERPFMSTRKTRPDVVADVEPVPATAAK